MADKGPLHYTNIAQTHPSSQQGSPPNRPAPSIRPIRPFGPVNR